MIDLSTLDPRHRLPMPCARCDAENPAGARFCSACGAPLQAACPQCGAALQDGQRFCNGCGLELAAAAADGRGSRRAPPRDGDVLRPDRLHRPERGDGPGGGRSDHGPDQGRGDRRDRAPRRHRQPVRRRRDHGSLRRARWRAATTRGAPSRPRSSCTPRSTG